MAYSLTVAQKHLLSNIPNGRIEQILRQLVINILSTVFDVGANDRAVVNRNLSAAAGNNFVAGNVGVLTTEGVVLTDITSQALSTGAIAMASETIAAGDTGVFVLSGEVSIPDHGYDLYKTLLLDGSAGGMTTGDPSGDNVVIRGVASVVDKDTIFFNPDHSWMVGSDN